MIKKTTVVASALFALLIVSPVHAQPAGIANDPHHPAPPAASAPVPSPGKEPGMPMMDMCRQMMGGMPMMSAGADPKTHAAMLEMRGEMMKAMGEIMMKHARRMQSSAGK